MRKHWLFLRHGIVPPSAGHDPVLTQEGRDKLSWIAKAFHGDCHLVGKRPVTLRFALSRTQRVRETLDKVFLPLSEQVTFDMPILTGVEKGIWSTAQMVLSRCEYYCTATEPQFIIVVGHGNFPIILAQCLWESSGGGDVEWRRHLSPSSGYLVSVGCDVCHLHLVSPFEPGVISLVQ